MKCANDHGYSVIRILQVDVSNDKNDWKNKLLDAIKKYDVPTNIFIGDVYTKYNFCTWSFIVPLVIYPKSVKVVEYHSSHLQPFLVSWYQ